MCLKKSTEFYGRIRRFRERTERLEMKGGQADHEKPEEAYLLHNICLREVKRFKSDKDS